MEVKRRLRAWISQNPEPIRILPTPDGGPVVKRSRLPDLGTWKVLIGDAANDFRTALDYLVHELVRLDSGHYSRRTKFPIAKTRAEFERLKIAHLRGLSAEHIELLEAVQPYAPGGGWTKNMQTLSNLDKHRHLTKLGLEFVREFRVSGPPKPGGSQGEIQQVQDVIEDPHVVVRLLLDDEIDAIAVLEEIQLGAYKLLCACEADFRNVGGEQEPPDQPL